MRRRTSRSAASSGRARQSTGAGVASAAGVAAGAGDAVVVGVAAGAAAGAGPGGGAPGGHHPHADRAAPPQRTVAATSRVMDRTLASAGSGRQEERGPRAD